MLVEQVEDASDVVVREKFWFSRCRLPWLVREMPWGNMSRVVSAAVFRTGHHIPLKLLGVALMADRKSEHECIDRLI